MAASVTLASTTLEGQLLELNRKASIFRRQFAEANPSVSLEGMVVTENLSLSANTMSFTITVPVVITQTTDGGFEVDARSVMVTQV